MDWEQLLNGDADEPQPQRRRAGRPKGSKTVPKDTLLSKAHIQGLYNKFEPYLTPAQREYLQGVVDGTQDLDVLVEMKLLARMLSLLFQETATSLFVEGKITKDIAEFANTLRQTLKDLDALEVKDRERRAKKDEHDLVRVAERRSTLERLEGLFPRDPAE